MMTKRDILYVEDNFHNRRIVRKILERKNFNLLEAEDGITGFKMIQDIKPHVVLLDISLPGMDGMEIAKRVKSDDATKHVVLIALTASAMAGDRERFLAAGCDDYLSKPFKAFDLIEIVEKHYEEAWAYRADRQTFEEPTPAPEPAEIMKVEPEDPVVEPQEEAPVAEAPVEVEAVVEAKEETPVAEEPVETEAAVEVHKEAPVEVETAAEDQEETLVEAKPEVIEPVAENKDQTPVIELPEVEAVFELQEESSDAEEPVGAGTVEVQQETPIEEKPETVEPAVETQEKTPVGDLRKALEAVAEAREDAPVETKKQAQEEPANAWLPEAKVLGKDSTQELEPPQHIPDTAELVLPSDAKTEVQEEPEVVQEQETPRAAEKVKTVLERLEKAETKSNNNKPKQETAPEKDEPKKVKPEDEDIFSNVFGMINSETIRPASPNSPSEK